MSNDDKTDAAKLATALNRRIRQVAPSIAKSPGVCGGSAHIAGTQIPVWVLAEYVQSVHWSRANVKMTYPHLSDEQINAALAYAMEHADEIDSEIVEKGCY